MPRRKSIRNIPYSMDFTGVSDVVESATNAAFGINTFSMSCFMKLRSLTAGYDVIMAIHDGGSLQKTVIAARSTSSTTMGYYDSTNTLVDTGYQLPLGKWVHVVMTKADTDLDMYVDGAKVFASTLGASSPTGANRFSFGRDNAASQTINGFATDAQFFTVKLTDAQVADLYYNGKTSVTPSVKYVPTTGSGATVTDTGSLGVNGTITGATWSTDTPSKRRPSVQNFNNSLDLVKASSQRVLFGDILNFTEAASFSLSTRFKLKSYDNNASLWDKFASGGYRLVFNSAGLLLFQLRQADTTIQTVTAPIAPTLNEWHEVVGVFDTSTVKIYLDGVLAVSTAFTLTDIGVVSSQLTLGYSNNNAVYLNGLITRSCIWSKALSASEISDLYYDGIIPTDSLEIHCDYSEGSGTTLGDVSGNGYNGTTVSSPTWSTDTPSKARTNV